MKINEIDTQFSMDNPNRGHYKLPSFVKPQTQPTDKEMNNEHISTLMKIFNAEAENTKQQMKATMRANGQTESSTDDHRSSMGGYKGKSMKGRKQTTYCSACGEPGHNASKCKVKHTLFCDSCNRCGHTAKACRHRMNRPNICVHCRLVQSNELCPQSCETNREDLRNSASISGLPKPNRYNMMPQLNIQRLKSFHIYPSQETADPMVSDPQDQMLI